MRLVSLGAVHTTHTPVLLQNNKNEINIKEIDKRGLCQNVDRHK